MRVRHDDWLSRRKPHLSAEESTRRKQGSQPGPGPGRWETMQQQLSLMSFSPSTAYYISNLTGNISSRPWWGGFGMN